MADLLFALAAGITLLALIITFVRLLKGPDLGDRVVALDAMTIISLSLIVYIARITGRIIYIDVALVYGLLSFLGVIAAARFMERGL